MCSDRETNERQTWAKTRPPPPPPARSSKRLPTEEGRLAEHRHAPAASLAIKIMDVADSLEQIEATVSNLKGTYIRRLRYDAGKARANATELANRTTAVGAQIALEQGNIQLMAQMLQVIKENEELKKNGPQPEHRKAETEKKSPIATTTGRQSQSTNQPPTLADEAGEHGNAEQDQTVLCPGGRRGALHGNAGNAGIS